jgi:hypothetical protein
MDWTPDYQAIATWTAAIGFLVGIFRLLYETKRARLTHSADTILKLVDAFDSMQDIRSRAASSIAKKKYSGAAEDILDFFERVAMLVNRKALDTEMTWDMFSYWMNRYWYLCKDYIKGKQESDSSLWEHYSRLIKAFATIDERKHGGRKHGDDSDKEELSRFLEEESNRTRQTPHNKRHHGARTSAEAKLKQGSRT